MSTSVLPLDVGTISASLRVGTADGNDGKEARVVLRGYSR